MRRNGNLPKFVTKYCVPRYGTSFEAEHRHERADETGNVYGQVFSGPLTQSNYRNTSIKWTVKDSFDWFIFSNLGFVGAPWSDFCYEEDYAFSYAVPRKGSLLHGGYFAVSVGSGASHPTRDANHGRGHYIITGKEIGLSLDSETTVFGPQQIKVGGSVGYYWGDERKNVTDPDGTTIGTIPEYLIDNSAFSRSPRRFSVYDGYWLRSYHAGKPIDNPVQSSWSSILDHVMPRSLAYDSFAGDFTGSHAWNNSTHIISKNEVKVDEEGTQIKSNEDSAEIVIFGYNGHGEYAFSQELGKLLDFGTYPSHIYPQSAKGRHCLLGNGIIGSTQFSLAYVSPELDGHESVELPALQQGYSLIGVSTNFCILKKENLYDLYYRLTPIVTNLEAMPNVVAGGSWYMDMVSRVATDMDTSESIDFSSVLPPNNDETTGGYSSGAYGTMSLCVYDVYSENGSAYIVSKYAVFKFSYNRANVFELEKLMAYPSLKHVREFVLIRGQIVYKIREDGFEAYDMQTFLRLDDLPGFQSAVEKVWENPNTGEWT